MLAYEAEVKRRCRGFMRRLSEKDRRRYAAVKAAKLGHGGKAYIARLFGCWPNLPRSMWKTMIQCKLSKIGIIGSQWDTNSELGWLQWVRMSCC